MGISRGMDDVKKFEREWNGGDNFIVAHTSGSTGSPKEIKLLKSDMLKSAAATNEFFGIDSGSLLVCPLSTDYIAGKMMYVRSCLAGCEVRFLKPTLTPLDDWGDEAIKLLAAVPSQVPGLVESEKCGLVENVIVGGGAVDAELERVLVAAISNCYATYGMTETCSHVALRRLGDCRKLYTGLPGFKFSTNHENRLIIENERMSFGRLITNDCARLVSDSEFELLGRFDNVIISGGLKIHPEVIELEISDLMGERMFYVSGKKDSLWGEKVVLVIEGERTDTDSDILLKARERVGKRIAPKEIVYVEKIERTLNGKIIRNKQMF